MRRTDITALGKGITTTEPDGYSPADLHSAYQLPADAGAGTVVAIVDAYNDPNAESDLAVYRAQYGLPACTTDNGCFTKVNQRGEQGNYPEDDTQGWAGEIALDLDMVSATCPQCSILLVEADDAYLDNLAAGVDTAVAKGAKYVSNSYGADEDPEQSANDERFKHPGVAVTASTGDYGYGTSYPATAPGVTAVGGTSLVADGSERGWTESAWQGAGSGCSSVTAKPKFQRDTGCDRKSVADVAAVADPSTGVAGYNTWNDSGWGVWGGTSASAPIIAATYALAGAPSPQSDPEEYPYLAGTGLNDVSDGSNGSCDPAYLCTAGAGYDGPTGLGTPNGVAAFRGIPMGTLSGTVTDIQTGKPLAGAQVSSGDRSATADADGSYTLVLPVGTQQVTAAIYGHASRNGTVKIVEDTTVSQDWRLRSVPSITVSGTVTDGSGQGWPLYAAIEVAGMLGGPVYTDPFTGRYSLTVPANSTLTMTTSALVGGYRPTTETLTTGARTMIHDIATVVDPNDCTAPGYRTQYTGGAVEGFENGIPDSWTVVDSTGVGGWSTDDPQMRGNLTGGSGRFAIVDSAVPGRDGVMDTELISPVYNLSKAKAPKLFTKYAYAGFVYYSEMDYTIDGGKTWKSLWRKSKDSVSGSLALEMPDAAGQSRVQVRFHYVDQLDYYFEVDDVAVGDRTCAPQQGGLIAGYVNDDNTSLAINGATVRSDDRPSDSAISMLTAGDPQQPDGLYVLFSGLTGSHSFSADAHQHSVASRYGTVTKQVEVNHDRIARADFILPAGQLSVTPASIGASVAVGKSVTKTIKLTNTGSLPLMVELSHGQEMGADRPDPSAADAAAASAAPRLIHGAFEPGPLLDQAAHKTAQQSADSAWESMTDMPTTIADNSMSSHDGKLYSVGGINAGGMLATAYTYDPITKKWSTLPQMGKPREAPASGWIDGKLYVTGGWTPGGFGSTDNDTEVYDPQSKTWSLLAALPGAPAAAGSAVVDGKLYVVGGCNYYCNRAAVQIYDPAKDSWSTGPAYPRPGARISCGFIGELVCAGGTYTATGGRPATSTAEVYALEGSTWVRKSDLPGTSWGSASSVANGTLVMSGGIYNSSWITNAGWRYDLYADQWTSIPPSKSVVYDVAGACGFYKVGGSNDDGVTAAGEHLPGFGDCRLGGHVPWLSESVDEAEIAPGKSIRVLVTMGAGQQDQPIDLSASLVVSDNSPYRPANIPVHFTVKPPNSWGQLTGTVTGRGCDGTVQPISGATVELDSWAESRTLDTAADGSWSWWLDRRNNPVTLIVAKDGWKPQTKKVTVIRGETKVLDMQLEPRSGC